MRSPVERHSEEAEQVVRDIRRAVRRQYSAKEKVRIVIAGLRGEDSIARHCRCRPLVCGVLRWQVDRKGQRFSARALRRRIG